ncbi:hypothetical protein [Bradyrhizobium lablabi]|uniref:hypothetical protein n=1 Tax=Bradyrhizobium lablabi TaxID=722472 RepID=UPI00090B1463|nr:hypothetical protein [Bradyrhizobium lablabi]SHM81245.1 Type IV leader peptidase family protein [Bradyrhizobium lablabi]
MRRQIDRVAMTSTVRQTLLSLTLLVAVAASLAATPGPDGLTGAFLAALMLAIAASDFRRYIIPNELTAAAAALALLRAGTIGPEAGWAAGRVLAVALPLLALMAAPPTGAGAAATGLGSAISSWQGSLAPGLG